MKDKIHDDLGMETLIVEADLFDPRRTSAEAMKTRSQRFLSTVFDLDK